MIDSKTVYGIYAVLVGIGLLAGGAIAALVAWLI